jgi:xylose isomerase
MSAVRYAAILSNFGACSDRFVSGGYSEGKSLDELFALAGSTQHLTGVELVGTWHINEDNVEQIRGYLERYHLRAASLIPDHFGTAEWGRGSFSSKDAAIRRRAVEATKVMMDIAADLGCDTVSLWPGQDGFDYSFQSDYVTERGWIIEGIRECARHRPEIRVALEYKPKEPRTHSYINTVGTTLLITQAVGLPNVGVTVDVGHALNAYENPADTIAMLKMHGDKLFHMHFNDNYRLWDDDMIVGSVHTIEYLELLYWLRRTGYGGWYSMDLYPYREVGAKAVKESIEWLRGLLGILDRLGEAEIERVIRSGEATEASALMRRAIVGQAG